MDAKSGFDQYPKVESRRMPGYIGQEGCTRCLDTCAGKRTRHYGEWINVGGFSGWSGWRGPYCSVVCYRADYPMEEAA